VEPSQPAILSYAQPRAKVSRTRIFLLIGLLYAAALGGIVAAIGFAFAIAMGQFAEPASRLTQRRDVLAGTLVSVVSLVGGFYVLRWLVRNTTAIARAGATMSSAVIEPPQATWRRVLKRLAMYSSLLAALAVACLWVRSYWRMDVLLWSRPAGTTYLVSTSGEIVLFTIPLTTGGSRIQHESHDADVTGYKELAALVGAPPGWLTDRGFVAIVGTPLSKFGMQGNSAVICVPSWFVLFLVCLTTLIPIFLPFVRARFGRGRRTALPLAVTPVAPE
jgi:hypothetical protein